MTSRSVSLLKLIDLAVGYPSVGSVSFNLLHKILYLLAVRDGSAENEEIELLDLDESLARVLDRENNRRGSQTRLMVQRVVNGSNNEHKLKVSGSRIVVPFEELTYPVQSDSTEEAERIESHMSAIHSVVSDLEEKVQDLSVKPNKICENELKKLNKRIEKLEATVKQQLEKAMKELKEAQKAIPQSTTNLEQKEAQESQGGQELQSIQESKSVQDLQSVRESQVSKKSLVFQDTPVIIQEGGEATTKYDQKLKHMAKDIAKIWNFIRGLKTDERSTHGAPPASGDANDDQNSQFLGEAGTASMDSVSESHSQLNQIKPSPEVDFGQVYARLEEHEKQMIAKIEVMEKKILRLVQEKADNTEIESQVRLSVLSYTRTRPIRVEPAKTDLLEMPAFRKVADSVATLSDKVQESANELEKLREELEFKTDESQLGSVTAMIQQEIRQLESKLESLNQTVKRNAEEDPGAGGKLKRIHNVRCISCDRSVTMFKCDQVIPRPPALAVARALKPNLRNQLLSLRKEMMGQPGSATRNLDHFDDLYRSLTGT
ncbi:girdin-like [Uranotaenia lowii]|uniref:girdin-like n=1 Tax=Uranotaenia lowii TaxID=190385 RepID=UPI002478D4D4|nr:girdin-like [Uranotaenia lowii]